ELLIWWPKYQPLPPLVTGSRGPAPLLGLPTTSLLIGNHTINAQDIAGYRLVQGWSLNEEDTLGFEGRYFFLGTRTLSQSVTDLGNDRVHAIGLPYINALTGQEDALPLARPGLSSAMTTVSITDRLQGAEANFLGGMIADQIDAHNEFHGGQVGLMADMHRGNFFAEITGKAALGTNFEMVRRDGQTNLITGAYPVPLLQSYHGGMSVQGSNLGQYTK